jgi:hypothetical protein
LFAVLLFCAAALATALDIVGRARAQRHANDAIEEIEDDEGRTAVLDIGRVAHGAHAGR